MTLNVRLNRTDDVVETCERVAAAELVEHGRRAKAELAGIASDGRGCVPTVTVSRRDGGLRVHIVGLDLPTAGERQAAIARALTALHVFDRSARTIDVVLSGPSTP